VLKMALEGWLASRVYLCTLVNLALFHSFIHTSTPPTIFDSPISPGPMVQPQLETAPSHGRRPLDILIRRVDGPNLAVVLVGTLDDCPLRPC